MVKNTNWTPISVSIDLAQSIESFVNSREGKKLGYTSKSGFVADAIREKLERDNSVKPQLDRIEKDLAFLTEKLIYEKTKKKLIKAGLYEPIDGDKLKQKRAVQLVDKIKVLKKNS